MSTVFNDSLSLGMSDYSRVRLGPFWLDMIVRPMTQPWTRQSFALDQQWYAQAYGWYHFGNIYLHLSACIALILLTFQVCWRLKDEISAEYPYKIAFATGVLYACHPLAAQTATYISARYSSLGAANFLLALNLFLLAIFATTGASRFWAYTFTVIFSWMCLTSSSVGIALPIAFLALFFLVKPQVIALNEWPLEHPLVVGILLALSIGAPAAMFFGAQPAGASDWFGIAAPTTVSYYATQVKALATYYVRCFFAPFGLSIDPPYALATSWTDPLSICGAIMFVAMLASPYLLRKYPLLQLAAILFLAGFLPHALFAQQEVVADPTFYLALSGLCVAAAWLATRLLSGSLKEFGIKLAPLVVVLAGLAIFHNLDFRNETTLIEQTLKFHHDSAIAHTLEARQALGAKQYQKAIDAADLALSQEPSAALAYLTKGRAQIGLHQYSEAEKSLLKATELSVKQCLPIVVTESKYALGKSLLLQHKTATGKQCVYAALTDNPSDPYGLYMLGLVTREEKHYKEAVNFLHRAVKGNVSEAWAPLAECILQIDHPLQAIDCAKAAIAIEDSPESEAVLAQAYLMANRNKEAEETVKKAIKGVASPDAKFLALMSVVQERKNDLKLAQEYRTEALKKDGDVFLQLRVNKQDNPKSPTTKPIPTGAAK